jgi:hypothetical protein
MRIPLRKIVAKKNWCSPPVANCPRAARYFRRALQDGDSGEIPEGGNAGRLSSRTPDSWPGGSCAQSRYLPMPPRDVFSHPSVWRTFRMPQMSLGRRRSGSSRTRRGARIGNPSRIPMRFSVGPAPILGLRPGRHTKLDVLPLSDTDRDAGARGRPLRSVRQDNVPRGCRRQPRFALAILASAMVSAAPPRVLTSPECCA